MMRMSVPCSRRCVAKQCRNVFTVTVLPILARCCGVFDRGVERRCGERPRAIVVQETATAVAWRSSNRHAATSAAPATASRSDPSPLAVVDADQVTRGLDMLDPDGDHFAVRRPVA